MFPNLKSAYLGLLGEACQIADTTGLSYAVCGGWSPFLRNSNPIHHPGTKDVDLLFSDGIKVDALHDVVKSFLKAGYLPSAKHEFQILRIFQVNNCELAFNIDLLHPSESF